MIKIIAEVVKSKADINGNRYYFATITDIITGDSATGLLSGDESNVSQALRRNGYEWEEFKVIVSELPIRQFDKITKKMPYMGCTDDEIMKFCYTEWNKKEN